MANRIYDASKTESACNRLRGAGDRFVVSSVEERDIAYLLGPSMYREKFEPTDAEFAVAKQLKQSLEKGQADLSQAQQQDVRTIITFIDNWYNKDKPLGA